MSGANQLYGDSHVVWKPTKKFRLKDIMSGKPDVPMVRGFGGSNSYY